MLDDTLGRTDNAVCDGIEVCERGFVLPVKDKVIPVLCAMQVQHPFLEL
jgi:hypothetical protein